MDKLRERLADLEHQQWVHWSESLLDQLFAYDFENQCGPSDELVMQRLRAKHKKWLFNYWKPYNQLNEKSKESDREWANKALKIFGEEVSL